MIAPTDRRLGKYEIREKLGRGGMADVYLAQDTEMDAAVALKLIEHSADADTCDAIEAERRGAELQARLADIDTRVVRVYASGDIDNFFYVAMEYVAGQDLADLMKRGRLEPEFACDTAIAIGETLEHAHNLEVTIAGKDFRGMVHGDIKPKNIRIDKRGDVRVLDFGIAKALSLSRRLTRNEFGSVPYASPERLDSGDVNVLSDLWSLAVMLYEMVTGLRPYEADTTERLERMIRSRIPPPPAPQPCPEPLRRILIKAMAPEPELRYQSARDVADDLIAFRLGAPVKAATEDLDATRRTTRRSNTDTGPDEATRRTARPGATAVSAPVSAAASAAKRPRSTFGLAMKVVAVLAAACVLYGTWGLGSGYFRYQRGQQLEREIEGEQLTDLDRIWTRWTELSQGNPSSLLLRGPRKAMTRKFMEAADSVFALYRNSDAQPVYEKDWERARAVLAHALAADPDDDVRGRLRMAEGHLARINGMAHHDGGQLLTAVDDFTQAERLLPKSPDPELGLARVYVYGLKDIDKAYTALEEAQRRGYRLGNRDKLQLADGYRERGDRTFWDSRNVRGLPQEKDEIARAGDDYKRAEQLYQSIVPYGGASAGVVRVESSLESVNTRLQELASQHN